MLVSVAWTVGCSSADPTGFVHQKDTVGETIAAVALGQVGGKACSPQVYDTSCTGNDNQPEYWCADFARWVWEQAGVGNTSELTAAAGSFYVYGQKHSTLHDTPSVGDAVVFDYAGGGYADHVALVTQVNGNGTIETVSGDWAGSGATEAAFSSTSYVALNAPAFSSAVGGTPSAIGMTVSGYVSPVGGNGGGGGGGSGNNGQCHGYMDGLYCGGDYVSGDSSTLYQCAGGDLSLEETCSNGCQVMPSGDDDQCAAASASNDGCAGYYDGLYCGGDYVSGDASTLYQCSGGNLSVYQSCAYGCEVMADGTNDRCY